MLLENVQTVFQGQRCWPAHLAIIIFVPKRHLSRCFTVGRQSCTKPSVHRFDDSLERFATARISSPTDQQTTPTHASRVGARPFNRPGTSGFPRA